MSEEFTRDLEAVFEERAGDFSSELLQLLEKLYDQGVLAGRDRERAGHLDMQDSKLSECGRYWCVPLPKSMLVLEGAQAGAERWLEEEVRQQPGQLEEKHASPFDEVLAFMDEEILGRLARQQSARDHQLPGGLVVLRLESAPRVPTRQPANKNPWLMGVDWGMGPDSIVWTKQVFASSSQLFASSPPTLTVGNSTGSGKK